MMKIRVITLLAVLVIATSLGSFAASAEETTVVATAETATGTRVLAPILPSALLFAGSTTASTLFSASVEEVLAEGVNGWFVTLQSGDFYSDDGATTISAENFSYAGVTNTVVGIEGVLSGTIEDGTEGALNGSGQKMFTVSGEVPGTVGGYSGTYTGTGFLTLKLPPATPAGIYTATITATLIA